jgi:hypothetical protein
MGFEKSDIDEAPLRLILWPHSHCQRDRKRERPHHVIDCRLRVVNGVADRVWLAIPQATKWQRIGY